MTQNLLDDFIGNAEPVMIRSAEMHASHTTGSSPFLVRAGCRDQNGGRVREALTTCNGPSRATIGQLLV